MTAPKPAYAVEQLMKPDGAPASPDLRTLTATCTRCGGNFGMTDAQVRVWAAYAIWDAEHKHEPAEETP